MGNLQKQAKRIAEAIVDLRDEFKAALIEKGVADPGDNISEYPSKILVIPAGGGSSEVDWTRNRVRYFDYDGTLLSEQYVEDGGAAVTPAFPDHEDIGLIFDNFGAIGADANNVHSNLDIVATYIGRFGAKFKVTAKAGETVVLPIVGVDNGSADASIAITVDWGSGDEVAAGYPSKTFVEDFEGYVTCSLAQGTPFQLSEPGTTMDFHIKEVIIGMGWVRTAGATIALPYHVFDTFMCAGSGELVDYTSAQLNFNIGYQIGGPLKRIIIPGQKKFYIGDCQRLELLSALNVNAYPSGQDFSVPCLYLPNLTTIDGPYGSCQFETVALPKCNSLDLGAYWTGVKQVWVGKVSQGTSSIESGSGPWAGVKKVHIRTATIETALAVGISNCLLIEAVSVEIAAAEAGVSTVVRNWGKTVSKMSIAIPSGAALSFSGTGLVQVISPYLLDFDWWEDFFTMIDATVASGLTIAVARSVYAVMPDAVRAIATAKGITLSAS